MALAPWLRLLTALLRLLALPLVAAIAAIAATLASLPTLAVLALTPTRLIWRCAASRWASETARLRWLRRLRRVRASVITVVTVMSIVGVGAWLIGRGLSSTRRLRRARHGRNWRDAALWGGALWL